MDVPTWHCSRRWVRWKGQPPGETELSPLCKYRASGEGKANSTPSLSRCRSPPAPGEARCRRGGGGASSRAPPRGVSASEPGEAAAAARSPPLWLPPSLAAGDVVGRQPQHPAAAGGAAEAGGGRGEDQGVSGGRRAPAVLYAERLQRCLARWGSCREQSLPRAPLLCSTLKTREGHQRVAFQQ